MSVVGWIIGGAAGLAVAIAGYLWYNAHRLASAETTAASEAAAAEAERTRAEALERGALEKAQAEAASDRNEASTISAVDRARAWEFLRSSFKDNRRP